MDANDRQGWERLTRLLDEDEQLWPRVSEALDEDADPWEALLDGLDDAGALAFLDAEDSGMEVADALAQLPRVFRLQPDLGRANDTDDLDEAMAVADQILAERGFRLLLLDQEDEEARALVVVPAEAVEAIIALAADLGESAETFD